MNASSVLSADEQIERKYTRLRQLENLLFGLLELKGDILLGEENAIDVAWEFFNDDAAVEEEDPSIPQLFLSWAWFDYRAFSRPSSDGTERFLPLAEVFNTTTLADEIGIGSDSRLFIRAGSAAPLGWYCIESVREGIEMELRDLKYRR